MQKDGFRSHFDLRNEKIGFKIREHTLQKVPYLIIIGDKEVEQGLVTLRSRDGTDLGQLSIEQVSARLSQEVQQKGWVETIGGLNH